MEISKESCAVKAVPEAKLAVVHRRAKKEQHDKTNEEAVVQE